MFQYLVLNKNQQNTLVEQVSIALEGECKWIHIPSGLSDRELDEIETLCRDKGAFLTVDDNVNLTNKRRFHGVLLNNGHENSPAEVRASLGAHAVVGAEVDKAEILPSLMKEDIDYAVYDVDRHGIEKARMFASESGMRHIPIVARGVDLTQDEIIGLMESGFNGVLTTGGALDSTLSTESVKSLTDELHSRF